MAQTVFETRLGRLLNELRFSAGDRKAIELVKHRVMRGESDLRRAMISGHVSVTDIIGAIENKRCLATPDHDLGDTYLKNVIGNAINDTFDDDDTINRVRKLFGLEKLAPDVAKDTRRRRALAVRARQHLTSTDTGTDT